MRGETATITKWRAYGDVCICIKLLVSESTFMPFYALSLYMRGRAFLFFRLYVYDKKGVEHGWEIRSYLKRQV